MSNLRSKSFWNFFLYRALWTLNSWERGLFTNFFWSHPNLRSKCFQNFFLYRATLDSEFVLVLGEEGSVHQLFWSCQIWGQKFFRIFSFTERSQLNFSEGGSDTNFFWLCQILEQKIFGIFFLYQLLWSLKFWGGGSGHQLFLVMPNLKSKKFQNFFLYWVLLTEFFGGVVQTQTFYGHAKFETKNFSEFFPLQTTLDSESIGGRVVQAPTFFWSFQTWGQ